MSGRFSASQTVLIDHFNRGKCVSIASAVVSVIVDGASCSSSHARAPSERPRATKDGVSP